MTRREQRLPESHLRLTLGCMGSCVLLMPLDHYFCPRRHPFDRDFLLEPFWTLNGPGISSCAGTGSFVVRGRGNPRSWNSCSHGAGRRMSRTRAKAEIRPVRVLPYTLT